MTRRGNTTQRSIRIPDPLWHAAQTVAADRGDNLSDIIRKALRDYIDNNQGLGTSIQFSRPTD